MHASPRHSCSWPFGEGMSKIPGFFPPLQPQLRSHLCFVGSNFLLLSSHQQNPGWEALFSLDSWAAEKRWLQAWGRPSPQRDPWLVLTGCRWVQKNGHVCSFLHHTPGLTSPQKWSSSPIFSPNSSFTWVLFILVEYCKQNRDITEPSCVQNVISTEAQRCSLE